MMGGGAANTDVPIFPIFPNPAPPRHRTFSRYRPSTARNATVISTRAAAAAVADGGMAVGRERVGPLGARTSPATTTALRRRLTRPSRWMPRGTASCVGSTAGSRPGSSSLRPWSTSGTTRRSISTSPRSGRRCRWTCDGCLATLSAVHSHARGREERELAGERRRPSLGGAKARTEPRRSTHRRPGSRTPSDEKGIRRPSR